jgi:hypothetical protein
MLKGKFRGQLAALAAMVSDRQNLATSEPLMLHAPPLRTGQISPNSRSSGLIAISARLPAKAPRTRYSAFPAEQHPTIGTAAKRAQQAPQTPGEPL